ncbi:MAG TPA: hypothetical protein VGI30_09955 [Caulobacteraceae bacterium]
MPLDTTDVTLLTALPTVTPASAQDGDLVPIFRAGQATPLQQATLSLQPLRAPTLIIDGGGAVIATGVAGALYVPFDCAITGVVLLAPKESGSVVVDIWKTPIGSFPASSGDSICASDLPTLSSGQSYEDTTLAGWTVDIDAGDTLTFNVDSVTTLTKLTVVLTVDTST